MDMKKSVLITGASGLLGRAIYKAFVSDGNWNVTGLAYSRVKENLVKVNLTSQQEVEEIFQTVQPDLVIHSAAERRPDIVETQQENTRQLNVEGTRRICHQAAMYKAPVLYMSTDYVFDGTAPPYKVTDPPNPLNKYGASKLEGEKVTMEISKDNMILRVPVLYGDVEFVEESAVTVLFPKVKASENSCSMSDYERRFPTHVQDVAEIIRQLSNKKMEDNTLTGIFHCSGSENMTKYDMAVAMANTFGLPSGHIKGETTPSTGATRPYNAQLDTTRLDKLGISGHRPFTDGVKSSLQPFMTSS